MPGYFNNTTSLKVNQLSVLDRPREKLQLKGRDVLSEAELIAVLINSGSRGESAVDLAKRILAGSKNCLDTLSKKNMQELMAFKGVGEAKAISIIAALELGRRRMGNKSLRLKIQSSQGAFDAIKSNFMDLSHEEFWVICLNRGNKIISKILISKGGISGTVVDIKLIFKAALEQLASSIIVCHNHPSGNLDASKEDKAITKKIKEAGEIMDVTLLDHLIISDYNYFSFADNGQI
ncbi:MAG: DNA repair protein RadC [Crocinitomicaceae bacterium]|jgi:DNA repair protein RadC|nr:DNA repair protein RadC [Crocinitomicaceae bacterium]MBT5403182.1 DNA repair protein RadC [Crocinitomicaceae bacterium]